MNLNKLFSCLFCISAWILLTLNFKTNIASSAWDFFNYFQYDSESLVMGRLTLSSNEGLASHAGFLGWVLPVREGYDLYWYQYDAFRYNYDYDYYQAWYSLPGVQAFIYGLICKITGLSGNTALETFWWLISMFTALIFIVFIKWVLRRWGIFTSVFVLTTIFFSQWITVFGRNIFWVLGIFYLPFVVALWYNEKYEKKVTRPLTVIFLLMFVTVLLKCLLTGFEYITTTLVMSVTPWIFYAVCNQWSWKSFVKRIVVASSGALAAVLTTLVWLSIQLSFMKGSIGAGFDYIMYSFGKRTYRSEGVEQIFKESTNSNVWDVLTAYWNSYAFDLGHWCANPFWQYICRIRFGSCIIIFFVFTVLILLSQSIDKHPVFRRQQTALSVMLWISMLAPLSWFVIFKGHSYIHTHMNSIVWHMPFMLLGATFVGSAVKFFVRQKKLTDNNIMDNAEQSINNSSGL